MSLGKDVDFVQSVLNPRPAWHVMHVQVELPYALHDSIHLPIHGLGHPDALGHVYFDGTGYNNRALDEVATNDGLTVNSIHAMREGIFTRGVLLDVAAATGVDWLAAARLVTPTDLEAAERLAGLHVEPGDAIVVHTGLERRAATSTRRSWSSAPASTWPRWSGFASETSPCIPATAWNACPSPRP